MTRRSFDSALWSLRVRASASPAAACARARVAKAHVLRFYLCSFQKRKISFKTACFLVRALCRLRIFESMLQKRKDSYRKWQIPCVMGHISSKNATGDRIRQISRPCKDHFCVFAQIPSENAKQLGSGPLLYHLIRSLGERFPTPAKSRSAHAGKWIRWIPDVQVSKKGASKKEGRALTEKLVSVQTRFPPAAAALSLKFYEIFRVCLVSDVSAAKAFRYFKTVISSRFSMHICTGSAC